MKLTGCSEEVIKLIAHPVLLAVDEKPELN